MGIPTWLLLLVVLIPTVCLIAYVSDNMGKQLGKKRISIFGLRPRQTATLLTMASGTGIMLLTFGALFGVSKQVRNDLFRAAEIREHNRKLLTETRKLSGEVDLLNSRIAQSQNTAEAAERRAKEAGEKATRAASQTKAAEAQLARAQAQLNNTRGLLSKAQVQLASAKRGEEEAKRGEQQARVQAEQAQAQARQAQARFLQAQARVAEADRRFAAAQQRAQSAEGRARQADAEVKQKQRQLVAATKNLNEERARLNQAQARLVRAQGNLQRVQSNVRIVQNESKSVLAEYTQKTLELASKQKEVNQLVQQVEFQKANLTALRSVAELALGGRVTVNLGQVFAERIILPGDAAAMQKEVRSLLSSAQDTIKEAPFGGKTLSLAKRTVEIDGQRMELTEDQIIGLLVEYLNSQRTPVAVRVAAARNYIEGETDFQGLLLPVAVRPAFAKNETITQAQISPTGGDARIFNALLQLINVGERTARDRGVSPPLTPAAPNFYASGTNERIFQALRQIATAGRPVTVRLVAADDLSTVEPLRVQFQVVGDES